jgi:hypothetical protein
MLKNISKEQSNLPKAITLQEAKELRVGQTLYHLKNKNADGSAQRWRVNGKPKLWKRAPEAVKVPIKNGLRNCDYLTHQELHLVSLIEPNYHLPEDCVPSSF